MDVSELTTNSPSGVYELVTESGSSYTVTITSNSTTLQRTPSELASKLRRDEEVLRVIGRLNACVGDAGYFELEGLGETPLTVRWTTPIKSILKVS